ncbi:MAG: hypothetical protein QM572_14975 [Nocardioides sp.]|uniref:hypothetical protein n=1 Tax=Nocardioides sp. TaxID=35761 RepID=UPI0039E56364
MSSKSYWYDVASGQVLTADTREGEAWLGPFGTPEEAEEAPATFIAMANAWLSSEEGERYLAMARDEAGDLGLDGLA